MKEIARKKFELYETRKLCKKIDSEFKKCEIRTYANLESYSFINMFYKYTQGQIDIGDSVTFITFAITCILLTITVMQRRKSIK